MKIALMTICYRESRLIKKFLNHIPSWVDKKLVLVSEKPWFGDELPDDGTAKLAEGLADVIVYPWETEEEQRNAGLEYLSDYDWVIVLDPDEFLDNENWEALKDCLELADAKALVVSHQLTYWKDGYVADPPRDYQMLIAVRPGVRFVDKRVVNTGYQEIPVFLHHMSWAKTDKEVWDKITHYAHANDFDTEEWFEDVWKKWKPGMKDVHPTTPETLHNLIPAKLPPELDKLQLWPNQKKS